MTRRVFLATASTAAAVSARPQVSRSLAPHKSLLSVEGYIFDQYAASSKQPLESVMGSVFRMTRAAGFRNIELNTTFFPPAFRERTLALLHAEDLRMPSTYVGGLMHEKEKADQTIGRALEFGDLCRPFGCTAIVHNPDPKPGDAPKTDTELGIQADSLDRMGRALSKHGFELRIHHHTPQLEANAREWRHILAHTDPQYVYACVDVDWAYEAGFDAIPFLRNVGTRLRELHVRSARNKLWLEDLEDSDIDYRSVAQYLQQKSLHPLIVVELAYRPNTVVTRSLEEDLRRSRVYAEGIFAIEANA